MGAEEQGAGAGEEECGEIGVEFRAKTQRAQRRVGCQCSVVRCFIWDCIGGDDDETGVGETPEARGREPSSPEVPACEEDQADEGGVEQRVEYESAGHGHERKASKEDGTQAPWQFGGLDAAIDDLAQG